MSPSSDKPERAEGVDLKGAEAQNAFIDLFFTVALPFPCRVPLFLGEIEFPTLPLVVHMSYCFLVGNVLRPSPAGLSTARLQYFQADNA